jgi:hypothetical protein
VRDQTSNLADLLTTAERVFSGELLTPQSHAQMVTTDLRGKTSDVPGCPDTCFDRSIGYTYGLGIVTTENWLVQDPLFSGESAVAAYLPSQKAAIAVAVHARGLRSDHRGLPEPRRPAVESGRGRGGADRRRRRSEARQEQAVPRADPGTYSGHGTPFQRMDLKGDHLRDIQTR